MFQCTLLLFRFLSTIEDHQSLASLCVLLSRKPEADKVYVEELERRFLCRLSLEQCLSLLRSYVTKYDNKKAVLEEIQSMVTFFNSQNVHRQRIEIGMKIIFQEMIQVLKDSGPSKYTGQNFPQDRVFPLNCLRLHKF